MYKVKITGMGSYVPEKILTNEDLSKMVDTNDEWIVSRTGIKERHIAELSEAPSDLAAKSAELCIKNSGLSKSDIDLLLVATSTFDMIFPSTACVLQNKLGLKNTPGYDILAACSGFVFAFINAVSYIQSGIYNNILITGVDLLTRITDWKDRNTCVLFGDGAASVMLSKCPENEKSKVYSVFMGADGSLGNTLNIPGSGFTYPGINDDTKAFIQMSGQDVFKSALKYMSLAVEKVLALANKKNSDIDLLICHQANKRIISSVGKRLKLPTEKVYINLEKYGNTSAATIPLAMVDALAEGKIKRGDTIALSALGGGVTYGGVLLKY
jgi:3-oxoacyl-[acyl-carrier-protein] synthase III